MIFLIQMPMLIEASIVTLLVKLQGKLFAGMHYYPLFTILAKMESLAMVGK